ncbi:bacterial Ig-like domain-containing protein [Bifidobacterium oedipodis]|uniref:bacterial Ig-like domain-containing protein n=1 Tax=Bifidobacterium oedipodis TaxID=2675322 RepID=UPI00145FBD88|nr:bacterial Ig-like domain-containing protein [Bifidobacterium sp. DSM 109957]
MAATAMLTVAGAFPAAAFADETDAMQGTVETTQTTAPTDNETSDAGNTGDTAGNADNTGDDADAGVTGDIGDTGEVSNGDGAGVTGTIDDDQTTGNEADGETTTVGGFTVQGGVSGTDYTFTEKTKTLTITTATPLVINTPDYTEESPLDARIVVSMPDENTEADITFAGVHIAYANPSKYGQQSAMQITKGALSLTLQGANSLKVTQGYGAGLENSTHKLTIQEAQGGGSLTAVGQTAAGIGGGRARGTYDAANITINSGTIIAIGSEQGAGIGGGWGGSATNITINGGNVTATGTTLTNGSAGIGGGYVGDASNITITGGVVNASGITGIGGGLWGDGSHITISGTAQVTATGNGGAGIGGGQGANGSDILISGTATVSAQSNGSGAAIGGGYDSGYNGDDDKGNGTNITITGGVTVTAIAEGNRNKGAAIGGGNYGNGTGIRIESSDDGTPTVIARGIIGIGAGVSGARSDVTISAGTITATGTSLAWPAIGNGDESVKVTIAGGTVTAQTAGSRAAAIGGDGDSKNVEVNISGGFITASATGKNAKPIDGAVSITGGAFPVEAYADEGKIYGVALDDGYVIVPNPDAATKDSHPTLVLPKEQVVEGEASITLASSSEYDGAAVDDVDVVTAAAYGDGTDATAKVALTWADTAGNTLGSAPTDAGTYKVTATLPDSGTLDANTAALNGKYCKGTTKSQTYTITQKPVALTWDGHDDRVEDDGKAVTATISDGVLEADASGVAVEVSGGDVQTSGTHTATATLTGERAHNYVIEDGQNTISFTIRRATSPTPSYQARIVVTAKPDKLAYKIGEPLDLTGLVVTQYTSGGLSFVIGTDKYTVTGFDSSKPGKQTITITLNDNTSMTASFTVTVATSDLQVRRLYNPTTGEHFYTANETEWAYLITIGWRDEGVGFTMSDYGTPVYRLYQPGGKHMFTTNKTEYKHLKTVGWRDEGIAFHVPEEATTDAYRLYNTSNGDHLFTTNWLEYTVLRILPWWRGEGVGFRAQ